MNLRDFKKTLKKIEKGEIEQFYIRGVIIK